MLIDLRQFLELLREEGELVTVDAELSPDQEITAAIREIEETEGKAVYIPAVQGYPFSAVGNLLGSRKRIELAFGKPADLVSLYWERRERPVLPKRVAEGPVQEAVHRGPVDLARILPALVHHEGDAGRYLTSAVAVARDPETGKLSCGIHRVQLKGGDRIGVLLNNPPIGAYFRKAESAGRPLPIAFVIGLDPVSFLSSVIRAPEGEKFSIAGGLAGMPLQLVRCLESDLEVPAHAEFVLEGEMLPGLRETEGPFGESSGYYMTFESPVGRILSVTHRKDAIYHALVPFSREDSSLSQFLWEAENLPRLRERFPSLARVYFPPRTLGLTVFAAVKPTPPEEVKALIQALWEAIPIAKNVIIVDHDVSLEDGNDLWWALSTRLRVEEGLWLEKSGRGMAIDPSAQGRSVTRMGIDATVGGQSGERFRRIGVAGAVRDKVKSLLSR
jgi:2,5-furandicarboxylate decarboxylase 1